MSDAYGPDDIMKPSSFAYRGAQSVEGGPLMPAPPRGCICPPTSERTCRASVCPRQGAGQPNDELAAIEERLEGLERVAKILSKWVADMEAGSKQLLENMRQGGSA